MDVTDRAAVQAWVDDVVSQHSRVDVLVNNAGILRDNQLVKLKDGELVHMLHRHNIEGRPADDIAAELAAAVQQNR